MKKPNFFIVGAPKCGTTAMSAYLGQHPEVFIPHVKEPYFFGGDLAINSPYRNEERYLSLFSAARDEKRVGEASVWYLYSERGAAEIEEFDPRAKIIIMLRDPVGMLYSLHSHFLYYGADDIVDFEAALDAEEDRKQGFRLPQRPTFVQGLFYREIAKYTQQVRRYFQVFGREHVHVAIFDDFQSDTAGEYGKTLRFLDLSPDFRPEFRVVNPNKEARSKALHEFIHNPPQIARRLVRVVTSRAMRSKLVENVRSYNARPEPRQPMDAELSMRLRAEFAPEVERLSELLGRDLTHWSRE